MESKKNGTDEPSGRAGIKTDVEKGLEDMGKGKLGQNERVALTYICYQI